MNEKRRSEAWLLFSFGLLVIAFASGCASNDTIDSTEVNNESFYGSYSVRYSEVTDRVTMFSQLRVGGNTGTSVRLVSPSKMEVNHQTMTEQGGDNATINLIGTYYGAKTSGSPTNEYTFVWTRDDGTTATNSITMPTSLDLVSPQEGHRHDRTKTLSVETGGQALLDGERLCAKLVLEYEDEDGNSSMKCKTECVSRHSDSLRIDDLDDWPTGEAQLSLYRERNQDPQGGHDKEGGRLTSHYSTGEVDIELY